VRTDIQRYVLDGHAGQKFESTWGEGGLSNGHERLAGGRLLALTAEKRLFCVSIVRLSEEGHAQSVWDQPLFFASLAALLSELCG
jgi:hypothetical protein